MEYVHGQEAGPGLAALTGEGLRRTRIFSPHNDTLAVMAQKHNNSLSVSFSVVRAFFAFRFGAQGSLAVHGERLAVLSTLSDETSKVCLLLCTEKEKND